MPEDTRTCLTSIYRVIKSLCTWRLQYKKHAKIHYFKQFQSPTIITQLEFFSETLNSQRYCDNIVYPFIAQMEEDEIDRVYFQQDGATVRATYMSMAHLDDVFADRIIPKTIWPPRSPDLSPSDFFFSGVRWKTQCIRTVPTRLMSWRWPSQNTFGMWNVLYWTWSSGTQFGVSINVWRLVGDTLNIACNFLYCNHQVLRNFLITLYIYIPTTLV
jgi:hypothetical protein